MKTRAWTLALLLTSATACAGITETGPLMSAEKEARALVGVKYVPGIQGEKFTSRLSCTSDGSARLSIAGVPYPEWSFGTALCQGRHVETLEQRVSEENGVTTWRIVDALLLPPVAADWDPHRQNKLQISLMGECTLDERTDTSFFALVRWRDRERVDWKTGVEHAWTYDIEKGRIVPVSTKRVVCEWLEP